jgi:hypothetical protein
MKTNTFGPAFEPQDLDRILDQMERIKSVMLYNSALGRWLTLAEVEEMTGDPQASISAQMRHLRKAKFGGYTVDKRRRSEGTWEYFIEEPSDNAVFLKPEDIAGIEL